MSQKRNPHSRQQGITLIVSLIMLVLLTMLALTTFKLGKSGLQLTDNAQQRSQAKNAAQATLDRLVSSSSFANHPTTALDNGNCPPAMNAPVNSTCTDLYGDGKTIINVVLTPTPTCVQSKTLAQSSLDLNNPEDLGCSVGANQNFGTANAGSPNSLCADSLWEISAVATESTSGATQVITEGVALRVSTDAVATACP